MLGRDNKQSISIVALGPHQSGKSTLLGHLILLYGGVDPRTINKFERCSSEIGFDGRKFSWLLDKSKLERHQGHSVHGGVWLVHEKDHKITFFDVPGRPEFVKNTINGISQSDVAVLVVDARNGSFEASISTPHGIARQHAIIAYSYGIKRMIVVVNRMDQLLYDFNRFDEIRKRIIKMLKRIGYNHKTIPVIPISAWHGDNLTQISENMKWWKKGTTKWGGMTLQDILSQLKVPKRRKSDSKKPLRISSYNSFRISGIGICLVGRVITGKIQPGDEIVMTPLEGSFNISEKFSVKSLESHYYMKNSIPTGDIAGINIDSEFIKRLGIQYQYRRYLTNKRGIMIGHASNDPPQTITNFIADIIVIDPPCEITIGYTPMVDCHMTHVPCRIDRIIERVDKETNEVEKRPKCLKKGDRAVIEMTSLKPRVIERFKDYSSLGRIIIRDNRMIVGCGKVIETYKGWEKLIWSRENHFKFPYSFRRLIFCVFMCYQRGEGFLSSISEDVLLFVIFPMINPIWGIHMILGGK